MDTYSTTARPAAAPKTELRDPTSRPHRRVIPDASAGAAAGTFPRSAHSMTDCRGSSFADLIQLTLPTTSPQKVFFNFQGNEALNHYAFARILKQHPECTYNVEDTSVQPDFLKRLSRYNALQKFGTAKDIDILVIQSETWIPTLDISHKTDDEIEQFIKALQKHTKTAQKITRLSLAGHKTVKIEQIRLIIEHMPNLTYIDLTDTGLKQAEIRQSITLGDIELNFSPVGHINSHIIIAPADAAPVRTMQAFYIEAATTAQDIAVFISRTPDTPFTVSCFENQIITVDDVKAILAKPSLFKILLNAERFTATDFAGLDPELATKIQYRTI